MRITAAHVTNFKRVQHVDITPDADRAIILIGGKNAAGKSSILDALTAAFGGKRAQPTDPVRHGADEAVITVELDGGELTIKRVIRPDGGSDLEVRDPIGAIRSPQAMLDKLVSGRFLDPLAFLALPAKEQRAALMRLIKDADRIDGLNEKRARAFDRRTELGRELTKAEGELARLPVVEVGTPLDVTALSAEAKAFAEQQRAGDGLGNELRQAERDVAAAVNAHERAVADVKDLERRLDAARQTATLCAGERESAMDHAADVRGRLDEATAAWSAATPRRERLDADLKRAGEHNRGVFEAEAHMKRRAQVEVDVAKRTAEVAELTTVLNTIDERKASILAAAQLPVAGLAVADDGIELNGVPFAQASRAEQLRVALALAMSASPGLADIWLRDAALLDDDSVAAVEALAQASGRRVWLERVSDRDPGVIVIHDGKVRDAAPTAEVSRAV